MNAANKGKHLDEVSLIGEIIDHFGTKETCSLMKANSYDLSRWRSYEIDETHENHRASPLEKIKYVIEALLIQEMRDKKQSESARELLDLLGDYYARLCGGVYITPDVAEKLAEMLKRED